MKPSFPVRAGSLLIFGLLHFMALRPGFSQCTGLDFTYPATTCVGQNIDFAPVGSYQKYEWDFCAGDLSQTPTSSILTSAFGGHSFKVELVEQNGSYYGFLLGQNTGALYRLDFGTDINSQPNLVNLGGIGINSSTWRVIEIVKEGNTYYGFIMDALNIYRVTFGTSLTNTPGASQVIYTGTGVFYNLDMVIVEDGASKFLFVPSAIDGTILRMSFPSSFTDTPTLLPQIITTAVNLGGISFLLECETWHCVASGYGNPKIYNISFGAGLSDPSPTIIDFPMPGRNRGLALVNDNDQYYAFTQQNDFNKLYRIKFGNSLTNTPGSSDIDEVTVGTGDLHALAMYKVNSDWIGMSTESLGNNIYRIKFPTTCFSNTQYSISTSPTVLSSTAGTYNINLRAQNSIGDWLSKSHTIVINTTTAPDVNFTSQNVCANNNVNFSAVNSSGGLTAYHWNYGDAGTGTGPNPMHTYTAVGTYNIRLDVDAASGCSNYVQKSLQIYNAPIANFNLPAVSPICTNRNYALSNTSVFDVGSNPLWEWRLNGNLVASTKDLTQAFASATAQEIRLKALIPGCQNELIRTISTVNAGPTVNFSATDNCLGNSVPFANTTTNADAGYVWTFDDGSNSTLINPSHVYLTANTFQVKLTASSTNGCQNFITKPVKIYSLPQPGFIIGLPPFSCSNSATPFQNTTPALTDSNINSWNWQFGEPTGASIQQQPSYTYSSAGNFNVVLTATSDKGCTSTFTKSITIAPSAVADFTLGPACVNQSTKFADASSGAITSRSWSIGTGTFTTTNPSYTFTSSGNFPVTLNVTAPNECINAKTKSVVVAALPAQNFSLANPCAGKNAIFTDATSSPTDAVAFWNWNFDGNSTTGNPTQFTFDAQGTFNAKMTTTHASGCKYTFSKNVLINPSPVASFTASPDRGAPPLTVQFINTTQQATSYAWKFSDKIPATSNRISPVYTFASLGDYSAELTATNSQGCYDALTVPIKVLVPSIDLIMREFSLVNDAVTGKMKAEVTVFNNSNVPIVSAEVSLFLADKAVVNETIVFNMNPGQAIKRPLSFTLSPTQFDFSFLCAEINSEKDIQQDNNKRCINLEHTDYFFGPYPNPSAGILYVDWISENAGTAHMIVCDNMGKKTYEWSTEAQSGLNQAVLDLTFLTSGLYYLTIETVGAKKTVRFVRQ